MNKKVARYLANHGGRLDDQRDEIGGLNFRLELLQEKINLLYDYLKLETRFHPPMTDIAKKGQKKR